jgi:hypothetical protein
MIVSYSPGRIRLRFKELKDKTLAGLAVQRIKKTPGINRAEINPVTGSVLIEHDE